MAERAEDMPLTTEAKEPLDELLPSQMSNCEGVSSMVDAEEQVDDWLPAQGFHCRTREIKLDAVAQHAEIAPSDFETQEPVQYTIPAQSFHSRTRQVKLDAVDLEDPVWAGLRPAISEIATAAATSAATSAVADMVKNAAEDIVDRSTSAATSAVVEMIKNTTDDIVDRNMRRDKRLESDKFRSLGEAQAALSSQLGLLHERLEKELENLRLEMRAMSSQCVDGSASASNCKEEDAPARDDAHTDFVALVGDLLQKQLQMREEIDQLKADLKQQVADVNEDFARQLREQMFAVNRRLHNLTETVQQAAPAEGCQQTAQSISNQNARTSDSSASVDTPSFSVVPRRENVLPPSLQVEGLRKELRDEIRQIGDRFQTQTRELADSVRNSVMADLTMVVDSMWNKEGRTSWPTPLARRSAAKDWADVQAIVSGTFVPTEQQQQQQQQQRPRPSSLRLSTVGQPSAPSRVMPYQSSYETRHRVSPNSDNMSVASSTTWRKSITPSPYSGAYDYRMQAEAIVVTDVMDKDAVDVPICGRDLRRTSDESRCSTTPGSLTPPSVTPHLQTLDSSASGAGALSLLGPERPTSALATPSRPRPQAHEFSARLPFQNGPPCFDAAEAGAVDGAPRRPLSAQVQRTRPGSVIQRVADQTQERRQDDQAQQAKCPSTPSSQASGGTSRLREEIRTSRFTETTSFTKGADR